MLSEDGNQRVGVARLDRSERAGVLLGPRATLSLRANQRARYTSEASHSVVRIRSARGVGRRIAQWKARFAAAMRGRVGGSAPRRTPAARALPGRQAT